MTDTVEPAKCLHGNGPDCRKCDDIAEPITVSVDLPEVKFEPARTKVRCGESFVEVSRYGDSRTGPWAAFKPGGHVVFGTGKDGCTYDTAIDKATEYVRHAEYRRLAHEKMTAELDRRGTKPK